MYGSRAVTPLVLISDDVINRILKLDIQTNILVYVTRCCTDLTSKVLKERTFGQSSAVLVSLYIFLKMAYGGHLGYGYFRSSQCKNTHRIGFLILENL